MLRSNNKKTFLNEQKLDMHYMLDEIFQEIQFFPPQICGMEVSICLQIFTQRAGQNICRLSGAKKHWKNIFRRQKYLRSPLTVTEHYVRHLECHCVRS